MANDTLSTLAPEQLAAIRSLNLRARLIVEGTIAGMHRSPYHGFSAEFLEFRPYQNGESVRLIDWRTFARTDRTVVRTHEDETNLYAHVLFDKSGSMGFRSQGAFSKYEYGRTLSAALVWMLIRQRDAVGFAAFDSKVRTSIPPRSTHVQLKTIVAELDRMAPSEMTGCGNALDKIGIAIKKRGLCIVVSDLFDSIESLSRGLRHLRFKRQDIIVIRVLDPFETDFSHDGPLRIVDLETGQQVDLDGTVAADAFRVGFEQHRRDLDSLCRDLGIDVCPVRTDEPFQKALMKVLARRSRLF